jgi:lipooligosaccharide transport system ATP-binding protein
VAGLDVATHARAVRARLGVVTQSDSLDTDLSVRQNLEVFGYLAGLSRALARRRAADILEFFALTPAIVLFPLASALLRRGLLK